ncbi:MAG: TetR family transcriptional regulator, partial [Patulibacter sp.]|nr:TetR family transcriptional regulator [Patulibacter sp.]
MRRSRGPRRRSHEALRGRPVDSRVDGMSPRAGLDPGRVADAAVAIADRDGLDGVTIARVAAELGVKGPSLYNHVASRDALV